MDLKQKNTMKNIILILMLLATACAIVNKGHQQKTASEIPEYRSLEELEGDTVSYIIQSFYERKAYYIGKKGKVFFRDLELEIVDDLSGLTAGPIATAPYVNLLFVERNQLSTNENYENKPLFVIVEFVVPPTLFDAVQELQKNNKHEWTKEEYNFYKNLIVENIVIPQYGIFRKYFEELE